ncbi:MAG: tripartite tricarboxylate transporter substrate binding protein [Betaproteobacteria bacterium]|nr:tripartite tricarboxylate transporter substrate binding protein [Betaproteobacteria bacterium]MBI2292679.1 tripartite tricarboxylate transporter substrate binding protein [Betaproteobacteria bacterium]
MRRSLLRLFGVLLLGVVSTSGTANAQGTGSSDYPRKSIRLVVPFAPGGPVDIVARGIAPRMSEILHQQIVVDNRGGAGSTIGTEMAANAPADGYTLLMVSGSFVINPAMVKKLPYDSVKDFAFISIVADVPTALVVHPSLPVRNVKELIALAKARPGELNYASPGRGTVGHLAAEWFSSITGVKIVHVPYKGAGPAVVDLMAGHVQLLFAAMPGMVQFARDGKVRMMGQGGKTRSPSAPDVPTFVESGLPGFILSSSFGLLAPAGTPRPIVERVRSALLEALADPAVNNRLAGLGAERVGSTPEEHAAFTKSEIAKWMKVTRQAGIQPE